MIKTHDGFWYSVFLGYRPTNASYVNQGQQSSAILSTDIAGGFTGCVIGLYATSGNDIDNY